MGSGNRRTSTPRVARWLQVCARCSCKPAKQKQRRVRRCPSAPHSSGVGGAGAVVVHAPASEPGTGTGRPWATAWFAAKATHLRYVAGTLERATLRYARRAREYPSGQPQLWFLTG